MRHATTSRDFFENKYRQNADPWKFEDSPYEKERYAVILRALMRHDYSRAFEPGCSVGVLTQALARRCRRLEAIDISPTAVFRAQERCEDLPNVNVQCGSLPEAIPNGRFDLIVFSEIGYYFERRELEKIIQELSEKLIPGGALIAVHWLGTSSDHLLSGDEVHEIIRENDKLSLDKEERYPHFRLDRMVRR
jgi:SAM-dependent methyltransferase